MAIIKQHDKRTGITYVYESKAYWDSEKKMSRAKRTLIGRLDPETGEVIPTDGRNRKVKADKTASAPEEPDYKKLYEQLQKKYAAQAALLESLQQEVSRLREAD